MSKGNDWGRFLDTLLAEREGHGHGHGHGHADGDGGAKPPARIKLEITLLPATVHGLDAIGAEMSESRRGRIIDVLVARWAVGSKQKEGGE